MNCQDIRASLLAGETSDAIEEHLEGCVECRRVLDDIVTVRDDLGSDSLWAEPPEGLEDSIVAAITGARPAGPETRGMSGGGRWSSRSLTAIFGSAAAVIILLVGVFAVVSRTPAPDWEAAMVGTDVAPLATGVVAGWNTDAGTRVLLEAADLGPAPDGFVYQLWFSKGSKALSAGTFVDPSHVELNVGAARKDYPDVWIALHPTTAGGGDAGPALMHTTDA